MSRFIFSTADTTDEKSKTLAKAKRWLVSTHRRYDSAFLLNIEKSQRLYSQIKEAVKMIVGSLNNRFHRV
jgi:hypothetical protein